MVRTVGLEPTRSPIRPSNVRVCQFRHDRICHVTDVFAISKYDYTRIHSMLSIIKLKKPKKYIKIIPVKNLRHNYIGRLSI